MWLFPFVFVLYVMHVLCVLYVYMRRMSYMPYEPYVIIGAVCAQSDAPRRGQMAKPSPQGAPPRGVSAVCDVGAACAE